MPSSTNPTRRAERSGSSSLERLEISSLVAGGEGLALVEHGGERRAVFVPRAAPGDVFEAQVDWSRRPARTVSLRLIQPSAERVAPPCAIAERCGGCDFMHLSPDAQLAAHARIVQDALERAGGKLPEIAIHRAARNIGYRTRARWAVVTERGGARVGYRQAARREVENVAHCAVLDPRLDAVLADVRELFLRERGNGEVSIALGIGAKPVLEMQWTGELGGAVFAGISTRVETGRWAGAEVWLEGARAPARFGDPRALTNGADDEPLFVPSGSFAQAHPAMNIELGGRLLCLARPEGLAVAELFAGSGNFTVLLARHAASVVAVESDARAVAAARANLEARGLSARLVERDADEFEIPPATRLVVLDPPRAGAAGAMRRIAASKARRVAYVSCSPATLARDVATLVGGGFRLEAVETFEMFPHTSHVEVLAILERSSRTRAPGGAG